MAAGSKPVFDQKVLSSALVVASRTTSGMSANLRTRRFSEPKAASWIVPVRS